MHVDVDWLEAVHFSATADSGHSVEIDGPPDLGGVNAGVRPMELMLMSVGSCAATDVVHILTKGRVDVRHCSVTVDAQRADEDPQVFTAVHLTFKVSGERLTERKLARAVELSAEKYCSASILMQRAGVNVTHEYELIAP
ncbi:MAG: OsmC family protein [Gammaproteobacteria bacterium]|nr:OsmC family protein [Gammaproteobacteria bacterium]